MITDELKTAAKGFSEVLEMFIGWMQVSSHESTDDDSWKWYQEQLNEAFDFFVSSVFPQGSPEAQVLLEYEQELSAATGNLKGLVISQKRSSYPDVIRNHKSVQKAIEARLLALKLVEMHVADPELTTIPARNWPLESERQLVDDLDGLRRWFSKLGTSVDLPGKTSTGNSQDGESDPQKSGNKLPEWSTVKSPSEWREILHWCESKWSKTVAANRINFRHEKTKEGNTNFKKVAIRNSYLSHLLSHKNDDL